MTIKSVKAVPHYIMQSLLTGYPNENLGLSILKENEKEYDKTWIISITNGVYPGMSPDSVIPKLIKEDTRESIGLQFDDAEPPRDPREPISPAMCLFNTEHALKICELIYQAHYMDHGKNLLLVNCAAGVSRSGAVSEFTRMVCNIPYQHWKRLNAQVIPNVYIKKILIETWENYYLDKVEKMSKLETH